MDAECTLTVNAVVVACTCWTVPLEIWYVNIAGKVTLDVQVMVISLFVDPREMWLDKLLQPPWATAKRINWVKRIEIKNNIIPILPLESREGVKMS
jgi:hypothetical protein